MDRRLRALRIRDGGCRFPGCDRPVEWCDAHHIAWWRDGGPTDLDNLILLCHRHHKTVHEGGWAVTTHPEQPDHAEHSGRAGRVGWFEFVDPAGHRHPSKPVPSIRKLALPVLGAVA